MTNIFKVYLVHNQYLKIQQTSLIINPELITTYCICRHGLFILFMFVLSTINPNNYNLDSRDIQVKDIYPKYKAQQS